MRRNVNTLSARGFIAGDEYMWYSSNLVMKSFENQSVENCSTPENIALSYEEYYRHDALPTPFDPSVYGENFTTQLRRDLLAETNYAIAEQVDVLYPHRDAVMRAVLEEVEFQINHRAEHNMIRQQMLQEYLESGVILPSQQLDSIIEKISYGTHDAAEAGFLLTSLPEDFDGLEVKKFTQFGMTLSAFHHEAYKTLGAFHRAMNNNPELGVTNVECYRNAPETFKQIPVAGAAPIGVFKQALARCEQNGREIELVTRGSYVSLPYTNGSIEHKVISMQQYVRRYRPSTYYATRRQAG